MAEVLHASHGARAGVQGPMTYAPPAQHQRVAAPPPAADPAWLPSGPEPLNGFALDGGARHQQLEPYQGAAAAAAQALGDDLIGRQPRRTPTVDVAAPYQKAAAQRSAERAIRPWDPAAGLGERQGAQHVQVPGANAGVGAFAAADAPSLFVAPTAAQVEAVAEAAGRVARGGQGQPGAEGAFGAREGVVPVRELWPVQLLTQPPRYCTGCRGGHEGAKVNTPEWQPYTPGKRLSNLQLLDTRFRRAMKKGALCFSLSDSASLDPVRWTTQPRAMNHAQFRQQLSLAFDGVREGHEPFRFLAIRAVEDMLAAGSETPRGIPGSASARRPPATRAQAPQPSNAEQLKAVPRSRQQLQPSNPPPAVVVMGLGGARAGGGGPKDGGVQAGANKKGVAATAQGSSGGGGGVPSDDADGTTTNWVADAVPELIAPIKLCLNTMQPQLVGGVLLLVIRLLRCHPSVPPALAPYSRHLLPTLAVFRTHRRAMLLPAPSCVPPTGSFSGSGAPHGAVARACRVCFAPLYGDYDTEGAARRAGGTDLPGWDPAGPAMAAEAAGSAKRLPGRFCHRYTLEALVEEVLVLLTGGGGTLAKRVVQNYIPAFDYYSPEDQPPCLILEEMLEAEKGGAGARGPRGRSSGQRPSSAPRGPGNRPASSPSPATAKRRPSTAAAAGAAGRKGGRKKAAAAAAAAELARWDGIEFRDVPYGEAMRQAQLASEPLKLGGGRSGAAAAALRISTPVPIFDSPHDSLFRMLVAQPDNLATALSYGKRAVKTGAGKGGVNGQGGVRRGGSGGGAPGANVNAEVPYKDTPAGFKRAF